MIEAKISRVLDNINQKKWADDDLVADLEFLTEVITKDIGEMRLVFLLLSINQPIC